MSKGKSMSKRTRTLILACVAVVALGGILTALLLIPPKESASSSEVSSDPSISLLDKSKGADDKTVDDPVKTMTVKLQGEEFTLVKNSDGDMVVEAYKDLPIGTSNIDYLISAVTTISASKKLGAVENPADFGFDKPLATVNVTYWRTDIIIASRTAARYTSWKPVWATRSPRHPPPISEPP